MTALITVEHTFEAAHRSLVLGGKCASLHGHSWRAKATVAAPQVDDRGVVVDFGPFKGRWRKWIDDALDHGTMLAARDSLVRRLTEADCKVFRFGASRFGASQPTTDELHAEHLPHPTVECVAELLFTVATACLDAALADDQADRPNLIPMMDGALPRVVRVDVQEKHDNHGSYLAADTP